MNAWSHYYGFFWPPPPYGGPEFTIKIVVSVTRYNYIHLRPHHYHYYYIPTLVIHTWTRYSWKTLHIECRNFSSLYIVFIFIINNNNEIIILIIFFSKNEVLLLPTRDSIYLAHNIFLYSIYLSPFSNTHPIISLFGTQFTTFSISVLATRLG